MTEKRDTRFTATNPKILMFPHLHEAVFMQLGAGRTSKDKSFSASFVIEPTDPDLEGMRRLILSIAKDAFPAEFGRALEAVLRGEKRALTSADLAALMQLLAPSLDFPITSGDAKADARQAKGKSDGEFMRGKFVLKASSGEQYPPALGGIENGRAVDYDTAEKLAMSKPKFFFGAEVFFQVSFRDYRVGNNKPGIKAYLSKVFATGKGTKLTSGASAAETFSGYMGQLSGVDPTAGLDELL